MSDEGGRQSEVRTLEMRVAELEDRLAGLQITEEEMRAYQKVSGLIAGAAPGLAPVGGGMMAAGAQPAVAPVPITQCIINRCIINQCVINNCIISHCINNCINRCIINQCIVDCTCGPCANMGVGGGFAQVTGFETFGR